MITVFWAGTFPIIKSALGSVSPFVFVSIRFTAAALILFPFIYKQFRTINRKGWRDGLILGVLFFLGFMLQTIGLNFTTASKSAFITGTFVVFTPIFQTVLEKKLPTKSNIIAIIMVFFGIFLIAGKDSSASKLILELGTNFNAGDFLTLLCAMFFGLYMVFMDMTSRNYDFRYLAFMQIGFTSIAALFLLPIFDLSGLEPVKFNWNTNLLLAFLYTGIITTIITTFVQTKYQRFVTPVRASIIFSMEPIFAMLFSVMFIGETVTAIGLAGAGIIICGLLFSELVKI